MASDAGKNPTEEIMPTLVLFWGARNGLFGEELGNAGHTIFSGPWECIQGVACLKLWGKGRIWKGSTVAILRKGAGKVAGVKNTACKGRQGGRPDDYKHSCVLGSANGRGSSQAPVPGI